MVPKLKLATGDFYYRDARADRGAARLCMQAGKRQETPGLRTNRDAGSTGRP